MNLYSSKYCTIEFDSAASIIRQNWLGGTSDMTAEQFKAEQTKLSELIRINKPRCICTDALNFGFVILPDLQEWNAREVLGLFATMGGKKIGMLVPNEIFTQVSIQQALDEANGYETSYFENDKELMAWLRN